MTRPEPASRNVDMAAVDEADAYNIEEFCRRHRISVQLFYKLPQQMPVTFRIGKRVLISREAAAAWRRAREASSATDAKV